MGSQHGQRYRQIVCRIEELLRNDRGEQLHVEDLCRAAGVSERTLRNAFRKIHGVSPYRYLRTFRMTQARQALLSADSRHGTVTEVAMQFGFLELGRFSVDYRSAFGECPSATLRRALEREVPEAPQIGFGPVPFPIEAMEPSQYAGHTATQHAGV
jgi:AraC family ethanolamine operon transcriptional activator